MVFLTLNRHSKAGINNYHSEIWADKAGYYVYLPSTFIDNWRAHSLPDSIDLKTGGGFSLREEDDKIITKYTYGVALMELPFFLVTHGIQNAIGNEGNGFTYQYARSIGVAACIWLVFGMYLLHLVLLRFLTPWQSIFSVLALLTSTNLFYYAVFDSGMSHVFSFFSFSLLLFSLSKNYNSQNYKSLYLLGLSVGLIIVIRPVNAFFIAIVFTGIAIHNFTYFSKLIKSLFSLRFLLPIILLLIPQFIYWSYAFHSFITFSYGAESFSNLSSPPLVKYLFAPHNGLIPYGFIWILFGFSWFFMKDIGLKEKFWGLFSFIILCYVFASWWNWNYGCGFGCRSLTEYATLFAVPFMIHIHKSNKRIFLYTLTIICIVINLKLTFSYDQCWNHSDWEWRAYNELLIGPVK
jgi:hypothetical protein